MKILRLFGILLGGVLVLTLAFIFAPFSNIDDDNLRDFKDEIKECFK